MKVKQSPLVEKLRGKPQELRKFFDVILKRDSKTEQEVTIEGKKYMIRRSPTVTERAGY